MCWIEVALSPSDMIFMPWGLALNRFVSKTPTLIYQRNLGKERLKCIHSFGTRENSKPPPVFTLFPRKKHQDGNNTTKHPTIPAVEDRSSNPTFVQSRSLQHNTLDAQHLTTLFLLQSLVFNLQQHTMSNPQYLHVPVRPSPLAQVHLTRPISTAPQTQGLVRDPLFWKRFSTAVHMNEVGGTGRPVDLERARRDTGSSSSSGGDIKREYVYQYLLYFLEAEISYG